MRARLRTMALVVALAVAPSSAQSPSGGDDDSADLVLRNDTVLVNVVVTEGTKFARGLSIADFTLSEDGTAQKIDNCFTEETPFAAAILLDTSGSMEYKLRLARVAAARFMDRARPTDRIAVYLFGSEVKRLQDFTPGGRDLDDSLWGTSAEGITKMYDAVELAATALAKRTEPRRAILLISDGADFGSGSNYDAALRHALASGATFYTIDLASIGSGAVLSNSDEIQARSVLKSFATKSGGRYFASKGGSDLADSFAEIVDELGHQYTLAYSPKNGKRDGSWRKIGVACTRAGVKLRARDGYQAPTE